MSSPRWTIRNNRFQNLGAGTNAVWLYFADHHNGFDYLNEDVEVSFNLVIDTDTSARALLAHWEDYPFGRVWVFRNTFVDGQIIAHKINRPDDGPVHIYNNVIINDRGGEGGVQITDSSHPERIDLSNNLVGTRADGIVDESGLLTDAYASYRGTHGR